MKNKLAAWIVGIGCEERKYKINNVTYTVSSHFEPFESKNSIKGRFERTIVSDFVPLTLKTPDCIMADECVCSAAGKEDNNAVEKEN